MAYDWEGAADGERAMMPEGWHRLRIERVIHAKRDGEKMVSADGDPRIMVVFTSKTEDPSIEAAIPITLSEKAGWVLARLLSRCGVSMKEQADRKIEITHYADPAFAANEMLGLECWASVSHSKGKYYDIFPVKEEEVPIEDLRRIKGAETRGPAPAKGGPPDDDPLPF